MFKLIAIVSLSMASFSVVAADELKPQSSSCQIVFEVERVNFYDQRYQAQGFCDDIFGSLNFPDFCFVRNRGGRWEANFIYRNNFQGRRFSDVFGLYSRFLSSRRLYGRDFNHRHRFFNCLE